VLLSSISFQDIKSREVYWFLFPLVGVVMSTLFFKTTVWTVYTLNIGINIALVALIVGVLYAYTSVRLKVDFWREAFGLGDALFFLVFAIGFPIVSFIVLFVGSLFFSLLMGVYFRSKKENYTIPLAGYMSLFLAIVFIVAWGYRSSR